MGVAFMDVGIYVTSLRVLKNLLLIGDAVKSIMFVAFQVCPFGFLVRCQLLNVAFLSIPTVLFAFVTLNVISSAGFWAPS